MTRCSKKLSGGRSNGRRKRSCKRSAIKGKVRCWQHTGPKCSPGYRKTSGGYCRRSQGHNSRYLRQLRPRKPRVGPPHPFLPPDYYEKTEAERAAWETQQFFKDFH